MILGANHIAISVPDMERALKFYCDLLGFKKITELGWPVGTAMIDEIIGVSDTSARVVHVGTTNLLIELFEFADCEPKLQDPKRPVINHGFTHLCLAVTDINTEYERLLAGGMKFNSAPITVAPGVHAVYGRDPFGNILELEEIVGRTDPIQPLDID